MALDYKNFMLDINDDVEQQVKDLDKSNIFSNQKLRLMPDAHPGKGCTIGTSLTFSDKIVPNIVGVDIACRVSLFGLPYIGKLDIQEIKNIDECINKVIPSGFNVRNRVHPLAKDFPYQKLACWDFLKNQDRMPLSMGTLGGGNHYIEIDKSEGGDYYLCIHSGSRNLGKQVAEYYQNLAINNKKARIQEIKIKCDVNIARARLEDKTKIQYFLDNKKQLLANIEPDSLAYLEGNDLYNYLTDMQLCNQWSYLSHKIMYSAIAEEMDWPEIELYSENPTAEFPIITCIHNYVDLKYSVIRKGSIEGYKDQIGIIPLNMRDGILLVKAKGNQDWNCSLPHGAGRLMSRSQAKLNITLEEFEDSMEGIYSTSVVNSTIDESPMTYKEAEDIMKAIKDNATILGILKPVYNFKSK